MAALDSLSRVLLTLGVLGDEVALGALQEFGRSAEPVAALKLDFLAPPLLDNPALCFDGRVEEDDELGPLDEMLRTETLLEEEPWLLLPTADEGESRAVRLCSCGLSRWSSYIIMRPGRRIPPLFEPAVRAVEDRLLMTDRMNESHLSFDAK